MKSLGQGWVVIIYILNVNKYLISWSFRVFFVYLSFTLKIFGPVKC